VIVTSNVAPHKLAEATPAEGRRGVAIEPRLLRAREVAQYMGLAPSTVYALIAAGAIPSVRIGSSIRVDPVQLDRWLDRQSGVDGTGEN